jgi:adenosylcobinamide kinase / adenosylcobinamide-phosphate guanylyltransferase
MTRTLIVGGARSGKSAYAEQLASRSGKSVVYVATAQARDSEMEKRIAMYRARRDTAWTTIEEQFALGDVIARASTPDSLVLVDCLTVWLSNLLFSARMDYPEVGEIAPPTAYTEQRSRFLDVLQQAAGDVILVSNEVGLGIVPQGAISRWFVDEAGRLNQAVATRCERAVFVAAGLPLALKGALC